MERYEKMGSAGLEDRRGRRIGSKPSRTPEEELRDRIAELERKNKDLQMENDLLKKVRELERRDLLCFKPGPDIIQILVTRHALMLIRFRLQMEKR